MAKKKKKTKVAKKPKKNMEPIGAMGISAARTVGLTEAEIIACETKGELSEAIARKDNAPITETSPLNKAFIARAKKLGVTDDKIAMYPDSDSLKQFLDMISPQTNPDAKVKAGVLPEPKVYDKGMPDIFELESKLNIMEPKNRVQFDEANLQAELRRINRKYGAQKPVRITSDKSFNITRDKNKLNQGIKVVVTKFKIFFKG